MYRCMEGPDGQSHHGRWMDDCFSWLQKLGGCNTKQAIKHFPLHPKPTLFLSENAITHRVAVALYNLDGIWEKEKTMV
jgi:hypothetical protein